jgi:hypothetical protein
VAVFAFLLLASGLPLPAAQAATSGVDLWIVPNSMGLDDPFVVSGEGPVANLTVENLGDAAGDATVEFLWGDGFTGIPFASLPVNVPATSTVNVSVALDTAGMIGYQFVSARLADITPPEFNGTAFDNAATLRFRVHTDADITLTGSQAATINTTYPRRGFVTVQDDAVLTIGQAGDLAIEQGRPDEFDILLSGNATLRIAGGVLRSNMALSILMLDNARLIAEAGSSLNVSVDSYGAGQVALTGTNVTAADFHTRGAPVTVQSSDLRLSRASIEGATLWVDDSRITTEGGLRIAAGAQATLVVSQVDARQSFSGAAEADAALPGIAAALSQGRGPFLPSVELVGGARATITETAVSSIVTVGSTPVISTTPIRATGSANASIYRTAAFTVTDPTGAPVAGALVEVFDYVFLTPVASAVAANGSVEIPLLSDVVADDTFLIFGTYRVVASRAAVSSVEVPLTFAFFPEFSQASLREEVPIRIDLFTPWGLYPDDPSPSRLTSSAPIVDAELVWDSHVYITANLNMTNTRVNVVQDHAFEHFVVVDGNKDLRATQSSITSDFAFNIYLVNGSSATFEGTSITGGNILISLGGDLSLTQSFVSGSIIGSAGAVFISESTVWGPRIELQAASIALHESLLAARQTTALKAPRITTDGAALSGTYVPVPSGAAEPFNYALFESRRSASEFTVESSPDLRIESSNLSATRTTLWSEKPAVLLLTGPKASIVVSRFEVPSATALLSGGEVTLEDLLVAPTAALTYSGTGVLRLRGVLSPDPAIAPGVTLVHYDAVVVTVIDRVGLPVPGASAIAAPLLPGPPTETAASDASGAATLYLHAGNQTSSGTTRGTTYRIHATRASLSSAVAPWEPGDPNAFTLTLDATFATATAEASYAVVSDQGGNATRIVATNLGSAGAVREFLSLFGAAPPGLTLSGAAFLNQTATLYVAADLVYAQGAFTSIVAMPGGNFAVFVNGNSSSTGTLSQEGMGSASFRLPSDPGNATFKLNVSASGVQASVEIEAQFELTRLPNLSLTAALSKPTFKPSEKLTVYGTVTFADGSPAPLAKVSINFSGLRPPRVADADGKGFFLINDLAPTAGGAHPILLVASTGRAADSEPLTLVYTVVSGATTPGLTAPAPAVNWLPILLGVGLFGVCLGVFYFAMLQRRVATGQFVECGNCHKPTYLNDKKCRSCGSEFEGDLAACSNCSAYISKNAKECHECGTVFSKEVERPGAPVQGVTPSRAGVTVPDIGIPESARKAAPGRLEEMEFRLPGTTETMDLADGGTTPQFAGSPPSKDDEESERRSPAWTPSTPPTAERMGLPRRDEENENAVREIDASSPDTVSLGQANVDLSRTTAAATATKGPAPGEEPLREDMLRELLMRAAPELSGDMLPGDIKRELQEIARSEAPGAAEKDKAARRPATVPGKVAPDERTVEAPEKSRKTAFNVFSTPAKNIPSGFERKGAAKETGPKAAQALVCPNCGGNWVVQRDGKNACRVCGTRW